MGIHNAAAFGSPFLSSTKVVFWLKPVNYSNGKDRKYAHMGFSSIFEYRNEKGGIVADFRMRCLFHLLHALESIVSRPRLGRTNISH